VNSLMLTITHIVQMDSRSSCKQQPTTDNTPHFSLNAHSVIVLPAICPFSLCASCVHVQMTALRAGLDGTPLVLIQGPPGTGKTRTILNLLSVVMHSAAKGSLELVPKAAGSGSSHMQPRAAAAAAAGAGTSAAASAAAERQRLWRLQSPWMFGEPTARDLVGPSKDTGRGGLKQVLDARDDDAGVVCAALRVT
jgi:hypothetical protein